MPRMAGPPALTGLSSLVVSRPPAIPWERIRDVLACYPDGLSTPEIAALIDPGPGQRYAAMLCIGMLRRREGLGHVRRAGYASNGTGTSVIWQLPPVAPGSVQ